MTRRLAHLLSTALYPRCICGELGTARWRLPLCATLPLFAAPADLVALPLPAAPRCLTYCNLPCWPCDLPATSAFSVLSGGLSACLPVCLCLLLLQVLAASPTSASVASPAIYLQLLAASPAGPANCLLHSSVCSLEGFLADYYSSLLPHQLLAALS
ncbi:hypothetical protein O6H91_06G025700 [Diphasiastrum complanatum]|uniref:Uncharacterized protein n=1 Tax=Diphasiastrum complanatum TaxID=34168 RepID=A0ACC2DBQ2_DIPCM|nr:hypothetical protein O6H91_Y503700 [Diphasiastrum complanatum]KAJ7198661.1 hypothetical protein O6H91_Y500400 [Diphasiastrum complanatum]KAJ7551716.1 hypothetical protein O6H91_06G025700 [Diphasiastrum complanatum]